jgi:sporulation protein YqfD
MWLKFLIVKTQILVPSMADVNALRMKGVVIYQLKKHPEGYLLTVRKGGEKQVPGVSRLMGNQSIYPAIAKFVAPIFAVFVLMIFFMNRYSIGYRIEGNLNITERERLQEFLQPHFRVFGPFEFLLSDLQLIEDDLRTHYNDFTWIEVTRHGNNVVVSVFDMPLPDEEPPITMENVLRARKGGTIRDINVDVGRVVVERNQNVSAGDHLVECSVLDSAGSGEVRWYECTPVGEVIAAITYQVEVSFPTEFIEEILTTRIQSRYYLNLGSFRFRFPRQEVEFGRFEERVTRWDPFFFLEESPLSLERVHYYEKRDIMKVNDVEGIEKHIDSLLRNKYASMTEEAFEIEGMQLIGKVEDGGQIVLTYLVTVLENIAH